MCALPVMILLLVAGLQRWAMVKRRLRASKGGGFGMFSDIQRHYFLMEMLVRDSDGNILSFRISDRYVPDELYALPTRSQIELWAQGIARSRWVRCGSTVHPSDSNTANVVVGVRARHLEIDFDGNNGRYSTTRVESYSFQWDSEL